jgi:catechol 2,3-dioxygenase-like lactoylglutathione lyase family enzyme
MIAVSHTGICVSDIDTSSRFYCGALQFAMGQLFTTKGELSSLLGIDGDLEFQCRFVTKDGILLELLQFKIPSHVGPATARPMNQLGFTHLSFRVDEIDAVAGKVIEYGGAVMESSRTRRLMPAGYVEEVMFCTDPDGTRIELMMLPDDIRFL